MRIFVFFFYGRLTFLFYIEHAYLLCKAVQVMNRCKETENKFGGLGFSWPTFPTKTQAGVNKYDKQMHSSFLPVSSEKCEY